MSVRLAQINLYHRELLIFISAVTCGVAIAIALGWTWFSMGQGTSVTVLGSGKNVSVLLTHEQRRVLIVSGTSGADFSNAVASALPAIGNRIDVLIIDPQSADDVQERARRLKHSQLLVLPSNDESANPDTILTGFQINLGNHVELVIDIDPNRQWTMAIESAAGRIALLSGARSRSSPPSDLAIMFASNTELPTSGSPAAVLGPSGRSDSSPTYTGIRPGQSIRIAITADGFVLPKSVLD